MAFVEVDYHQAERASILHTLRYYAMSVHGMADVLYRLTTALKQHTIGSVPCREEYDSLACTRANIGSTGEPTSPDRGSCAVLYCAVCV